MEAKRHTTGWKRKPGYEVPIAFDIVVTILFMVSMAAYFIG